MKEIYLISCIMLINSITAFMFPSPSTFLPLVLQSHRMNGGKRSRSISEEDYTENCGLQRKKSKEERLQLALKKLQVHVIGLSIHHADVNVREKLAIPQHEWNNLSRKLCSLGDIEEAAILSTCNRFEVYFASFHGPKSMAQITGFLAKKAGLSVSQLRKNIFMLYGYDAVCHLMRVSGGLDSLVVGEGQILSQVKQSYLECIEDDGCGGKILSRMLNTAVAAGKRVRSETNISKGSMSISSVAVKLSESMSYHDLNLPFTHARVCIVGAGTMTRLLITHLVSKGFNHVTIVNRSLEKPRELQKKVFKYSYRH